MEQEFLQALDRVNNAPSYSAYSALSNQHESLLNDGILQEFDLAPLRVAVLRNFTIEPILPILKGEVLLSGFSPEVFLGDFDAIASEILRPDSSLYQFSPDVIVIAQWLETLSSALTCSFLCFSSDQIDDEIKRIADLMATYLGALRKQTSAPILIHNFPLYDAPSLGILDAQSTQFQTHSVLKLNAILLEISKEYSDVYWVDVFGLFSRLGRYQAFDERNWQVARAPLGKGLVVPLGQEWGKFIRAIHGKSRKCLVLDCDNTLWGGVIGEDGISGIQLGSAYPGSSFQSFQQEILNLYHRGVILALCSKNNETDVLEVLRDHPGMLLKEEHFATWQINWDDKATNLARIAVDLNIGIDSFVFVDDSEFECNWVKKQVPQVKVLHLQGAPSTFRRELSCLGLFDSLTYSVEDKKRTKMYVSEKERKQLLDSSSSFEAYLKDLQIKITVDVPGDLEIPRVSQLTQKTNQFNLTTQRYTEGDIQQFVDDPDASVFCIKMSDRISDYGIIGVVILRIIQQYIEIDSFLISCRALGRGVESALMDKIISIAKNRKCDFIVGRYIQSQRNAQVADLYERLGFRKVENVATDSEWIYKIISGAEANIDSVSRNDKRPNT